MTHNKIIFTVSVLYFQTTNLANCSNDFIEFDVYGNLEMKLAVIFISDKNLKTHQ